MYSIDVELKQIVCCKSQSAGLFVTDMEEASSPALVLKSCPAVDSLEEVQIDVRKCYRQTNPSG